MYPILFTGLACGSAGALCALLGDLQRRPNLGLAGFLVLNVAIWVRFFHQAFAWDLVAASELFLLGQGTATCFYLTMVWFLDPERDRSGAALSRPD